MILKTKEISLSTHRAHHSYEDRNKNQRSKCVGILICPQTDNVSDVVVFLALLFYFFAVFYTEQLAQNVIVLVCTAAHCTM
jgi:hypothetical protein